MEGVDEIRIKENEIVIPEVLNGEYAKWFNRRFGSQGHLWGERFKNLELLFTLINQSQGGTKAPHSEGSLPGF